MAKNLGKQPIRVIFSVDGQVTGDRIENLVVYQKADGSFYSNLYGRTNVTLEDGQYVARRHARRVQAVNPVDLINSLKGKAQ